MKLTLPRRVYDAMLAASRAAAPLEACGLLGGVDGVVEQFYELRNTDAAAEHYNMAPDEQFAVVKEMRAKRLRMVAIWHSHPVTPARMSEEDLRMAYTPDVVYVIVSLADPQAPDIKGFTVEDGTPMPAGIEIS
ncbi:MAG: M67 family metallopeptidase [Kiritimatiellia bacterium]|jgi:proteasome lid subunit RPN8/RPN11|nr:M67 family metallopeptidase [Kiritimatiellia bacterium]MDP6809495.1 M67 family metallopeptidase [Kiritimatiellia bacterium]MDP7023828.1 M67 family metallopeptidase [Kiritimatiellia bacterium]